MTLGQHKTIVYVVILFLAAGGIILDMFTPLGVADWVWYFIPLLLSVYVGDRLFPYALAAVFSLLTLVGFFISPPGIDPHLAFMSRLMGICVQWLMAFLIYQRKRAEGELRTANEFNKQVIFDAGEGIIVYDRELRYRLWNRFMEQLTGLPAEEVLGRKALDLFPQFQGQGVDRL
jgi:PAS domain-containing protein